MTRLKILEILDELEVEYISRTPNGGGWVCCRCPLAPYLHERGVDHNPSFFVKVDSKGVSGFRCFTCHSHGRLSSLARKLAFYREEDYNSISIKADMAEAPEEFGGFEEEEEFETVALPEPMNPVLAETMYPAAWGEFGAREYLKGRGIGRETADTIGLRFDPDEKRILFPVMDRQGLLFGFSGRSILEPKLFPKRQQGRAPYTRHKDYRFRKEKFLLGAHLFQKGKPLWVVEGLFAYAHMVEIGARGWCNPVAPMGSTISETQRGIIVGFGEPTYLCFDLDKAGDEGLYGPMGEEGNHRGGGAIDKLKREVPVMVPLYPEGLDDIDKVTNAEALAMMNGAEVCG